MPKDPLVNHEPIAIVGVSAIFPGSIDKTGFWRDILAGKDLISDVPPSHWLIEDYYDPDPKARDKTYARRGGFLPDIDFDPMAWGVPPSILPATDTTQLLALVVAQRVLQDACGSQFDTMDKSRVSVILGVTSAQELLGSMVSRLQKPVWVKALREMGLPESQVQDACTRIADQYVEWEESSFPGLLGNVVAGRIANRLNLGGTNCVTDAACASSFSAISMAVNELHLGHSDLAIAGGADTMNDIFMYMCFSKTPALSPTEDCRPFSDAADGTMLGEGIGMVALKRLSDAEREGHRIYALLKGIGASSDGRAKSVYAPRPEGQAQAITRAYEQAGFSANTVGLIEAHGTGTAAGDIAEFNGLCLAYAGVRQGTTALGSVKSQIGHTKAAAGAAGLFKAVMALHHKVLPPTIKVERPNSKLGVEQSPFYINTKTRPWVAHKDTPRRAGVSAFGFGGSNFHLALEEYLPKDAAQLPHRLRQQEEEFVLLHAPELQALQDACSALQEQCIRPHSDSEEYIEKFLTFAAWKTQHAFNSSAPYRLSIIARDTKALHQKLGKAVTLLEAGKSFSSPDGIDFSDAPAEPKSALLFPGQGSQSLHMGADMAMAQPAAQTFWDNLREHGADYVPGLIFPPAPFNITDKSAQEADLRNTRNAQPAIGATSLSTLAVLNELDIKIDATAGHSFGEVSALHAAGALGTTDFMQVAQTRGKLMAEAATRPGSMLSVDASVQDVQAVLDELKEEHPKSTIGFANFNAPKLQVLSGDIEVIGHLEKLGLTRGWTCKPLPVSTAFHSPIVAHACAPFSEALQDVDFNAPHTTVYNGTTAQKHSAQPDDIRKALSAQIAEPIRFVELIEQMYADGIRVFIEVGPGSVLTGLVDRILGHHGQSAYRAIALDRKNRNGYSMFQRGLAKLAVAGMSLDFSALWKTYAAPVDPQTLPKTAFTIKINGAGHQKPYPPKGGAKALPKPNPENEVGTDVRTPGSDDHTLHTQHVSMDPKTTPLIHAAHNLSAATTMSNHNSNDLHSSIVDSVEKRQPNGYKTPDHEDTALGNQQSQPPTEEVMQPQATISTPWMAAFQAAQEQTLRAHMAYQNMMAESHRQFLHTAQTSMKGLATMMGGGEAVTETAPETTDTAIWASTQNAPPASPTAHIPKAHASCAQEDTPTDTTATPLNIEQTLLTVVAEKTGYPLEMVGLDMDIEADLGIDSIKRVEILSAVHAQGAQATGIDPASLAHTRTLREIVQILQDSGLGDTYVDTTQQEPEGAISNAPINTHPTTNHALEQVLLDVVAEKTGYPKEMLGMHMDIEADLGIDSIKRVEILSAVQTLSQDLPELDPAALASTRTLGEILAHLQSPALSGSSGGTIATTDTLSVQTESHATGNAAAGLSTTNTGSSVAPNTLTDTPINADAIKRTLLDVVADKTGYPLEMVSVEADLEADLGIDSIKRVEILSAMQDHIPGLPQMDPSQLSQMRTLEEIITCFIQLPMPTAGTASAHTPASMLSAPSHTARAPQQLSKFAVETRACARPGFAPASLFTAAHLAITHGPKGLREQIAHELAQAGITAHTYASAQDLPSHTDAVICLIGLQTPKTASACADLHGACFELASALAQHTQDAPKLWITIQDTGGDFGLSGNPRAWLSGIGALSRTAAKEWPDAQVRAIDIERGKRKANTIAKLIVEELLQGGEQLEVGIQKDGTRTAPHAVRLEDNHSNQQHPFNKNDVVVVSGGGRGVTAQTVVALAQSVPANFLLLGRTTLQPDPSWARGIQSNDDAALKRALLNNHDNASQKHTPVELGRQVAHVLACREIRSTMEAIGAAGGKTHYYTVDITDTTSVHKALDWARRNFGSVTRLMHGAGVLADKRIVDKTRSHFDKVFHTKVLGLSNLLQASQNDPLLSIILFSSVAARYGNIGQVDYAMANEVLNKVAAFEQRQRAETCVVRALAWGPWDGGMVTASLRAHFDRQGVGLLPLREGAQVLVEEIDRPRAGAEMMVTYGGKALSEQSPRYHCSLAVHITPEQHQFLLDHKIQGTPVLPVAVATDWIMQAAALCRSDLKPLRCRQVQVLKGVSLNNFASTPHTLFLHAEQLSNGADAVIDVQIRSHSGRPHYRALVDMVTDLEKGTPPPALADLQPWNRAVYGDTLFHGARLQTITTIHGVSDEGLHTTLLPQGTLNWPEQSWRFDPALIDGALQTALLWTAHLTGAQSLPTGIDEVVIYATPHDLPLKAPLQCTLRGRPHTPRAREVVTDIWLTAANGKEMAVLRGVRTHTLSAPAQKSRESQHL